MPTPTLKTPPAAKLPPRKSPLPKKKAAPAVRGPAAKNKAAAMTVEQTKETVLKKQAAAKYLSDAAAIEKFHEYMEFKILPMSAFMEFEGNPRYMNPDGHERLQHSIKRWKWTNPVLLWLNPGSKKYEILAGHQRCKDAAALGVTKAPCMILKQFKTKSEAMAYVIADNQLNSLSEWDVPKLEEWTKMLSKAPDIVLEDTGFTLEEIRNMFDSEIPVWDPITEGDAQSPDDERQDLKSRVVVRVKDAALMDDVTEAIENLCQELWPDDTEIVK